MRIKEYRHTWPPSVTIVDTADLPPKAELEDLVVAVENRHPKGELGLVLRKRFGPEYTVALSIPASLQEKILFSIIRKKNITLREVGELDI